MGGSAAVLTSQSSLPRLTAAVAAVVMTATAAGTASRLVSITRSAGSPASHERASSAAATALLILVLVAATWSLVADRPRAAAGLAVVGLAWLLPGFASVVSLPPLVRAALVALPAAGLAGIDAVVACWTARDRPVARRSAAPARSSPSWLCLFAVLAHLLGYSPFADVACALTCEPSPAPLAALLGPRNGLGVSVLLVLAAAACVAARAWDGHGGAPAPVRWTALLATGAMAGAAVLPWWTWGTAGRPAVFEGLTLLAVAALCIGVLTAQRRARRIRRNVAVLLDELAEDEGSRSGRGPRRPVYFTGAQVPGWVDRHGIRVDQSGDVVHGAAPGDHLVLDDEAGPALRMALGPGETADQVLAELTPAARMALENARLDALASARFAELRASQHRIVAATDAERSRIERDLHDGAQQQLVAVSLHLRAAAGRAEPSAVPALGAAALDVREALEALRGLAHGRVPAVLFHEGVAVAVRELATTCSVPVQVATSGELATLPRQIAVTAYMAASAALENITRHARARRATLTITAGPDTLTLHVVDDGRGGASLGAGLTDVADRVGALGGRLSVADASRGGTVLEVVIPCAS